MHLPCGMPIWGNKGAWLRSLRALHPRGPCFRVSGVANPAFLEPVVLYLSSHPIDKYLHPVCFGFGCLWQIHFVKIE